MHFQTLSAPDFWFCFRNSSSERSVKSTNSEAETELNSQSAGNGDLSCNGDPPPPVGDVVKAEPVYNGHATFAHPAAGCREDESPVPNGYQPPSVSNGYQQPSVLNGYQPPVSNGHHQPPTVWNGTRNGDHTGRLFAAASTDGGVKTEVCSNGLTPLVKEEKPVLNGFIHAVKSEGGSSQMEVDSGDVVPIAAYSAVKQEVKLSNVALSAPNMHEEISVHVETEEEDCLNQQPNCDTLDNMPNLFKGRTFLQVNPNAIYCHIIQKSY